MLGFLVDGHIYYNSDSDDGDDDDFGTVELHYI